MAFSRWWSILNSDVLAELGYSVQFQLHFGGDREDASENRIRATCRDDLTRKRGRRSPYPKTA